MSTLKTCVWGRTCVTRVQDHIYITPLRIRLEWRGAMSCFEPRGLSHVVLVHLDAALLVFLTPRWLVSLLALIHMALIHLTLVHMALTPRWAFIPPGSHPHGSDPHGFDRHGDTLLQVLGLSGPIIARTRREMHVRARMWLFLAATPTVYAK